MPHSAKRIALLQEWILPLLLYPARSYFPIEEVRSKLAGIYRTALRVSSCGLTLPILAQPPREGGYHLPQPRAYLLWQHAFQPGCHPVPVKSLFSSFSSAVSTSVSERGCWRSLAAPLKVGLRGRESIKCRHSPTVFWPGAITLDQYSLSVLAILVGSVSRVPAWFLSVVSLRLCCSSLTGRAISAFHCCLVCGSGSSCSVVCRLSMTHSVAFLCVSCSTSANSMLYACSGPAGVRPWSLRKEVASGVMCLVEQWCSSDTAWVNPVARSCRS